MGDLKLILVLESPITAICEFCGKELMKSSFRDHKKRCRNLLPYKCLTCDKGFTSNYSLQQHNATQHLKLKNIVCDRCGKGFATNRSLSNHIRHVHNDETFKCHICGKVFAAKNGLTRHIARHDPLAYPCPICGDEVTSKKHMKIHTHPFKCGQCCKRFINENDKIAHACRKEQNFKATVSASGLFECSICTLAFHKQMALYNHVLKIHADKLQCSICLRLFSSEVERQGHSCPGRQVVHNCDFCGQSFDKKELMHLHRKLHTHKFKCYCCSKRFIDENTLNNHICLKKGQKPKTPKQSMAINRCKICKIDFQLHHEYLIHKKQHEIYQCPECPKRFASKKILWSHRDYMHNKRIIMSKKHEQLAATGSVDETVDGRRIIPPVHNAAHNEMRAHFDNSALAGSSYSSNNPTDIPYIMPQQVVSNVMTHNDPSYRSHFDYFSL